MEHVDPGRWRRAAGLCALFGWLCAAPTPARAQTPYTLRGTVMDEAGGVLVDAAVEVTGAGRSRTVRTDTRGEYSFADLPPGEYAITAGSPGFESTTVRRRVAGRSPLVVDIVLRVLVTAEVSVASADGPGEAAASSLLTRVLSGDDLDELPSSTSAMLRRLQDLAGATGRPGDVVVSVDGFRRGARLPPREAIQSIRISSNPFAAEFAEPGRSRVEIVTKPGLERYSGQLEFNFNDRALNARHPFVPERSAARTESFQGHLGGPVVPKRWSLMAYGGRWREGTSDVINATILDQDTLEPTPFVREIVTPRTIDNAWLGSTLQTGSNHVLAVSMSHTRDEARNQGLDGGVDLPDRAYTRGLEESFARAAITSALNPRLVSELRAEGRRVDSEASAASDSVAIDVLDAFNSGGNQTDAPRRSRTETVQFNYQLTLALGRTTFKAGLAGDTLYQEDLDRTGFGGTFVFGTDVERDAEGQAIPAGEPGSGVIDPLEAYRRTREGVAGYGPSQFWIVEGDPRVAFRQWSAAWFAQGDWTPSARFTLAYGVRQEFQSHVSRANAISPRVGLAWSPDEARRNTLRAGAGVFYDRIPAQVVLDVARLDGARQRGFVVSDPTFFPEIPEDWSSDVTLRTPTISTLEPGLETPVAVAVSLGFDRRLASFLHASVAYDHQRGSDLLRTRNVNAPIDAVRPAPELGAVRQYETSGRSERHELLVAVRTNWERRLTAFVNYTLASARSDTDGPTTRPADSYDLSGEFAPSRTHARHQATAGTTLRLRGAFVVSAFAVYRSGRPFNITTGLDNNGDTFLTDRPAFADANDPEAIVTPFGVFRPRPRPRDTIVARNYGREPAEIRVDLHVQKSFGTGLGRTRLRLGADVVNVFNRPNRSQINGVLTSLSFGRPRRALDPRTVELFAAVSF